MDSLGQPFQHLGQRFTFPTPQVFGGEDVTAPGPHSAGELEIIASKAQAQVKNLTSKNT